jgi:hypothetical protein
MGVPTPTPRTDPTGGSNRRLPDGFSSKVTFAAAPALAIWERAVKPPGPDGGEPIDISTMFNSQWHTMYPRTLKKMDSCTYQAAYDPDAIPTLLGMVNSLQVITVTFPFNDTLCFWGWLRKFEPQELKEGEFPMANVTIEVSNYDGANEQSPVYTASGGT